MQRFAQGRDRLVAGQHIGLDLMLQLDGLGHRHIVDRLDHGGAVFEQLRMDEIQRHEPGGG